jgi:hypothetical protein
MSASLSHCKGNHTAEAPEVSVLVSCVWLCLSCGQSSVKTTWMRETEGKGKYNREQRDYFLSLRLLNVA